MWMEIFQRGWASCNRKERAEEVLWHNFLQEERRKREGNKLRSKINGLHVISICFGFQSFCYLKRKVRNGEDERKLFERKGWMQRIVLFDTRLVLFSSCFNITFNPIHIISNFTLSSCWKEYWFSSTRKRHHFHYKYLHLTSSLLSHCSLEADGKEIKSYDRQSRKVRLEQSRHFDSNGVQRREVSCGGRGRMERRKRTSLFIQVECCLQNKLKTGFLVKISCFLF